MGIRHFIHFVVTTKTQNIMVIHHRKVFRITKLTDCVFLYGLDTVFWYCTVALKWSLFLSSNVGGKIFFEPEFWRMGLGPFTTSEKNGDWLT